MKDTPRLSKCVHKAICDHDLIERGDSVLVCVSGGVDSVALLLVLLELRNVLDICLGVAHFDHGLRGAESFRDRQFVAHLADEKKLPFYSASGDVTAFKKKNRLSLEDAARRLRYDFFEEIADQKNYDRIATAHTADDNAELLLMNLFRGSGLSGLSGIPVQRGRIVRPFLTIRKTAIQDFMQEKRETHVEDSSNATLLFTRNRIRHDLLPRIKVDYQPEIVSILNRTALLIKEEDAWLDELSKDMFQEAVVPTIGDNTSIRLSADYLSLQRPAAVRRVLRQAVKVVKGDLKKIDQFHVGKMLEWVFSGTNGTLDLPDQVRVEKKKGQLIFTKHFIPFRQKRINDVDFTRRIDRLTGEETKVSVPECFFSLVFRFRKNIEGTLDSCPSNRAWIDYDRLDFPLTIRPRQEKDGFIPLGMSGHQSLKKFFQGAGVKAEDRSRIPLLVSGGHIVWVCGHRINHLFRIRPETEKVLEIELFLD